MLYKSSSAASTHIPTHACETQGINPRQGLPKIRQEWVKKREQRGDKVFTQMHYAKKGVITEEMAFCAARERLEPEFVRSEVSLTACYCRSRSSAAGSLLLSVHLN